MNLIFDVDGTLTPSRDKVDPCFEQFFLSLCSKHSIYLVTGSDYSKTLEQLGEDICHAVKAVYNCSGNVKYVKGVLVSSYDFELTQDEIDILEEEQRVSGFSVRTGNHIEKRIGAVNFSIVGRNAKKVEREQYKVWDEATGEREQICRRLNRQFARLEAVIGGETGIDLFVKGRNKAQIKDDIKGTIIFFGDRCEPGGNDYSLAKVADVVYHVKDWQETEYILRMKYAKLRSE